MKQVIQAEGIDEKRWPARMLSGFIDSLEEPRACAPEGRRAGRGRRRFANGKGGKLYRRLSGRV